MTSIFYVTSPPSSVTPAKAGAPLATSTATQSWIPAFAGMTVVGVTLNIANISVHP